MSTYEVVIILDDRKLEDNGETFTREMAKYIKSLDGIVRRRESLGRKHFARPIGKHRSGTYWDFIIDLPTEKVTTLQERYKLDSALLRIQVLLYQRPPKKAKARKVS